jgi:hypothetical protein
MNKLFFACIILSLLACRKDDSANAFPADLKIDSLLKFLPDALRNKSATTAVFSNEAGVERRFTLRYSDTTLLAQSQGRSYNVDKKSVTYTDLQNRNHRLWISLSGNYAEKDRILYLDAGITPTPSNPITAIVSVRENDDPRIVDKRPTMSILDRTFTNVYSGAFQTQQAFSQICYNQEYGIVGYRGEQNEWWVFRRFE